MPTILISYRRADTAAITGRIFDRLTSYYGEESVFMDIDNIPFGVDFRSKILDTLKRTDIVLAVIGSNWIGADATGSARINEPTDAVRLEIETALAQKTPIIPVLVDGAKMPAKDAVPDQFGDFVYLNAADVAIGRDFRTHVDRLIEAIDLTLSGAAHVVAPRLASGRAQDEKSAKTVWLSNGLRYLAVPLVVLVIAHHVIVNAFDLRVEYLWAVSATIPFIFGFLFFWVARSGAAAGFGFACALGIVAVIAMTVSQSLNSGDPIMPQNRFEWRDNIQFAAGVALSYLAGHALARILRAAGGRKLPNK
jgi:hypothetical protein